MCPMVQAMADHVINYVTTSTISCKLAQLLSDLEIFVGIAFQELGMSPVYLISAQIFDFEHPVIDLLQDYSWAFPNWSCFVLGLFVSGL